MKDAVVSIAAGSSQLGLIEAIRARGLAPIGVDRDPKAPGLALCEASVVTGTHAAPPILEGLRALAGRFNIRAIATQSSGPPVATTARVAAALGLPGLDPARALLSTSKVGFAELCREARVAIPSTTVLHAPSDLLDLTAKPHVLKPGRGTVGKQGVVLARTSGELAGAYERARSASLDGTVVAQEFIDGQDLSVVALFRDGEVRPIATLDERVSFGRDGEARGAGVDVPSSLAGSPAANAALASVERLADQLGTGVGFFAFRVPAPSTGRPPVAIEAHLDLAGDFVTDVLLARGAGVDLTGATLDLLLGEGFEDPVPPRPARLSFLYEDDRASFGTLADRGELVSDFAPVGGQGGGRVGYLLEPGS